MTTKRRPRRRGAVQHEAHLRSRVERVWADPVCEIHGKRLSQHECRTCVLCGCDLTPENEVILKDGTSDMTCWNCAWQEVRAMVTGDWDVDYTLPGM